MRTAGTYLAVLFFCLALTAGCQNKIRLNDDGELYQSFLPPREASLNEPFGVDLNHTVTVTAVEIRPDASGKPVLLVTYDWQNGENGPQTLPGNLALEAEQGGVSLQPDLSLVAVRKKLVTEAPAKGRLAGIQQGFMLKNEEEPVVLSFMGEETTVFIDGRP